MYLYIVLSIYLYIVLSIYCEWRGCPPANLSIFLFIYLSTYLYIYISIYLFIYLSNLHVPDVVVEEAVLQETYLYIYLSIYLAFTFLMLWMKRLSSRRPIYLSIYLTFMSLMLWMKRLSSRQTTSRPRFIKTAWNMHSSIGVGLINIYIKHDEFFKR